MNEIERVKNKNSALVRDIRALQGSRDDSARLEAENKALRAEVRRLEALALAGYDCERLRAKNANMQKTIETLSQAQALADAKAEEARKAQERVLALSAENATLRKIALKG